MNRAERFSPVADDLAMSQGETQADAEPTAADRRTGALTIGELARAAGVTLRALRFYQTKGLLTPGRSGPARVYSSADRERLALILQGKRLGFTLGEIRAMIPARDPGWRKSLPISRGQCIEQINLLERRRRDIDLAVAELRRIYTGMFAAPEGSQAPNAAPGKSPARRLP
jgi:DNA-binding transcriptional MerR regulator